MTLPLMAGQEPPPPPRRLIPADKGIGPQRRAGLRRRGPRRLYRGPGAAAVGMPVGGICAGQLYLLGDGTLGGWHVDGRLNPTGYGATSYAPRPMQRELAQGFTVRLDGGPELRLAGAERGGSFDAIEFAGEYPLAEVRYRGGAPQPLQITLRAYSPFVPLDARRSALPCTILRFALRNASAEPVAGTLSGFLQNGVEMTEPGEVTPAWRNTAWSEAGSSGVLMDARRRPLRQGARSEILLADFEGTGYGAWTAHGPALGDGPAPGTLPGQQRVAGFRGAGLVNTYRGGDDTLGRLRSPEFRIERDHLTFLIGGGGHAGRTCVNLLVKGAVVRSANGRNDERLELRAWDVRDLAGAAAVLEIVDDATGPWGHVNVDHIVHTDRLPEELQRPAPGSPGAGSMALAALGPALADAAGGDGPPARLPDASREDDLRPPVAAVHTRFALAPGEACERVFVVAWHFPNLHTGHGQMYASWFADAREVARFAAAEDQGLWRDTSLFHRTFYEDTTLPWWLALRLMMPAANLATGTAQWWRDGRFWGWEGVGCCHGTCTHVWNYAHAEARLFPELARSARLMQDLGTAFEESTGRVAFRGEVRGGFEYAADGQAGTVLKCLREHLCAPDEGFLRQAWPRIRSALLFLIGKDGEGTEPDGVIEGNQHNTYDIDFVGPNTFVGSLYLAALLAGAALAERVGDVETAARCRALYGAGRAWTEANLWNGAYFVQRVPPGASSRWQYGAGCLSDQLFGQTWARLLDLGSVYEPHKVRTALHSVFRHNWAPDVGPCNEAFPPERVFAEPAEGGLFVCTWPQGGRPEEPVRYRDEVWTGCEYQVAAGMLWEGRDDEALVDEALEILDAIDRRYDGARRNPWNEVECGDHYARAMASWGAYQAACGFVYDGPAGVIGMAPRLGPDDFAALFVGAEGWGLMRQRRAGGRQVNRFEVRWGRLRVSRVMAELDPAARAVTASATLLPEGRGLAGEVSRGERAGLDLAEALVIQAGEALEVTWG